MDRPLVLRGGSFPPLYSTVFGVTTLFIFSGRASVDVGIDTAVELYDTVWCICIARVDTNGESSGSCIGSFVLQLHGIAGCEFCWKKLFGV